MTKEREAALEAQPAFVPTTEVSAAAPLPN
jgi:hypothetical protein